MSRYGILGMQRTAIFIRKTLVAKASRSVPAQAKACGYMKGGPSGAAIIHETFREASTWDEPMSGLLAGQEKKLPAPLK